MHPDDAIIPPLRAFIDEFSVTQPCLLGRVVFKTFAREMSALLPPPVFALVVSAARGSLLYRRIPRMYSFERFHKPFRS